MNFSALSFFAPADAPGAIPLHAVTAEKFSAFEAAQSAEVKNWLAATGFKGEAGRIVLVPRADGTLAMAVMGLGKDEDLLAFGTGSERLPAGIYRVASAPSRYSDAFITLGWALGAYAYRAFKPKKDEGEKKRPLLSMPDSAGVAEAMMMADAIALARDLVNAPANHMGPGDLEDQVLRLAERSGARFGVIEGEDLLGRNYPLIHAVGASASAERAPRLIELVWGDDSAPKVTLVGKGVCFDSGGLNIKPGSGMATMKKDMGGAAAMIALARMVMDAKLNVRLRLLVPAVENAISDRAYRPGDVFTSRKGLTVEIGNTDAEGRLVLADALADGDDEAPELMVCMATLTGAARTATGFELPPFFTHDEALAADLARLSVTEQDPMWRLPLWKGYESWIEGKVGQLTNSTTSPYAGSITAALFLNRFVTRTRSFVHFDVAAWIDHARPGRPVGGEALCIRALFRLMKERFGSKTT